MGPHRILLTAGSNAKGQLGIGSYDDAHTFIPCQFAGCESNQLPGLSTTVTHVACGANHTILLLRHLDGSTTLWGTGDGGRGQLGPWYPRGGPRSESDAERVPWTVFRELSLGPGTSYTSCGYGCTHVAAAWETTYVVLSRSGSSDVLLSMGSNEFGALGVGDVDAARSGSPCVVDFDHVFSEALGRRARQGTIRIRSLHAGPRHVVAQLVVTGTDADADGSSSRSETVLVGWGASRHGQLGQNGRARFVPRPARLPIHADDDPLVSCGLGNQHTVVLHASGRISALGSNKQGQIPSLGTREHVCALGCTWNGTYMQVVDGDRHILLSTGNNAQGQLGRSSVDSASEVDAAVSLPPDCALSSYVCGSEHVLATTSSSSQKGNSVVGWGWNEHGNLGLGTVGNIAIPMQLWPRVDAEEYRRYPQRAMDIWAGCATSWLLVE